MSKFTRDAIRNSFLKLLNERPLSQIKVKDIVEDCGINRNTFYYYFHDIPSLIEDMVMEEAERIIREYPWPETIEDFFDTVINIFWNIKTCFFIFIIRPTEKFSNPISGRYVATSLLSMWIQSWAGGRSVNRTVILLFNI